MAVDGVEQGGTDQDQWTRSILAGVRASADRGGCVAGGLSLMWLVTWLVIGGAGGSNVRVGVRVIA